MIRGYPLSGHYGSRSDLVTIGLVCGSRNSGHVGIWGQTWNPDDKHIRTTGMNCCYVWCIKDEDKQYYRDRWGFEPVKNSEDMIGNTISKAKNFNIREK